LDWLRVGSLLDWIWLPLPVGCYGCRLRLVHTHTHTHTVPTHTVPFWVGFFTHGWLGWIVRLPLPTRLVTTHTVGCTVGYYVTHTHTHIYTRPHTHSCSWLDCPLPFGLPHLPTHPLDYVARCTLVGLPGCLRIYVVPVGYILVVDLRSPCVTPGAPLHPWNLFPFDCCPWDLVIWIPAVGLRLWICPHSYLWLPRFTHGYTVATLPPHTRLPGWLHTVTHRARLRLPTRLPLYPHVGYVGWLVALPGCLPVGLPFGFPIYTAHAHTRVALPLWLRLRCTLDLR